MIEGLDEAHEYLNTVYKHLDELMKLSENAGLYRHASIWCAIRAAFVAGIDEIDIISGVLNIYVKHAMKRYESNLRTKAERISQGE